MNEAEELALSDHYACRTIAYYEQVFGTAPKRWWPAAGQICEPPGCNSACK